MGQEERMMNRYLSGAAVAGLIVSLGLAARQCPAPDRAVPQPTPAADGGAAAAHSLPGVEMKPGGDGSPVSAAQLTAARVAFEALPSYRGRASIVSMGQGGTDATLEVVRPDRLHLSVEHHRQGRPAIALEVIRIGADRWIREGSGDWRPVPPGRELHELPAATGVWFPDPEQFLTHFLEDGTRLTLEGESRAQAGPCLLWGRHDRYETENITETLCVRDDGLPLRLNAGGHGVEAYLSLELYDPGASLQISPPSDPR